MQHAIKTLHERTSALANEIEMICLTKTNERLAVIVHELVQPITVIRMLIEQFMRHSGVPSQEALTRVLSQVDDITAILKQSNNIYPIPNLAFVYINPVIREALELVCMVKRPRTIQATLDLDGDVQLEIDKGQITQVLTNLIRNAFEAGGQHLCIKTTHKSAGIEIAVIDDGPGIDPSIADRLFEPFVTSKPSGAGIGLSVSRTIVRAHHGELSLRLMRDKSTRFVIYLPTA